MDTDIVQLLYGIKINIRKVEAGDRECLNDIESDFYKLMELLKLFLISEQESYYGYFLLNMSFHVAFNEETIAGIKLNEYPPVFVSNPLLLCKFSLKEILFIMCHEIEHVILNHPAEMLKCNPTRNPDIFMRFNYAADASVNDRIISDIARFKKKYLSFPDGCIDSPTFADTFNLENVEKNESYLYYYNLIKDTNTPKSDSLSQALENAAKQDQEEAGGHGGSSSDSKDNLGQNRSDDMQSGSGEQKGEDQVSRSGDDVVTSNDCKDPKTHDWNCGDDPEAAEELVREYVNSSYEMMNEEIRGKMPASFISQIELLNRQPVISWEKVLKRYVGTITAGHRRTRTRLNRRQPERFDLSGKMEDKTLKIVVAIDTSASVGPNEVARIFDEIFNIVSKRKFELTIIECDAKIQRVYRVTRRNDVQTSVRGRGGTSFAPVIEFINNDRYYRDALLIYFTDGFGEHKIPKPKTYRIIWVVLDNEKNLSLEDPYGIVLKM